MGAAAVNPFRGLIDHLLFNRSFILTYHLAIFAVVLTLAVLHWAEKAVRWRRQRITRLRVLKTDELYDGDAETDKPKLSVLDFRLDSTGTRALGESSSSGGSTLGRGHSPLPEVLDPIDENSPLLHQRHLPSPWLTSRIKAFLMYQPRNIPLINKTLPSNGTTIIVLAMVSLNIFYTFYRIVFTVPELAVLAERSGLAFIANLPLLYLLAAKNQPLKILTGCSYESLNIIHRRLGEVLCLQALLHAYTMLAVWYTALRELGVSLSHFLSISTVLYGIGAFLCYELLYLTSLRSFRQRFYEVFLGLHIFFQAGALGFLYLHQLAFRNRIYILLALAIFLIDRLIYRLGLKSATITADIAVMKDGETTSVSMTISRHTRRIWRAIFGQSVRHSWSATDHVFITIPSLGRKHILQAHPFTIASPAPEANDEEMYLRLLIRSVDGFSRDLLNQAKHMSSHARQALTVRLDGPYGSYFALTMIAESDHAILVAGGSGIAVLWPLVHYLLTLGRSTDTEIIPISLLKRQNIVLIWIVHKLAHTTWLSVAEIEEIERLGVQVIVPDATEDHGRPDLKGIIRNAVVTFEAKKGNRKSTRVVVSGPDSMNRLVRNTCSSLVGEGSNVDVAVEKYGW
ncbi:hypothetical protein BJ878DRAFT_418301 [Calycina marina]|uniref:FAD-binding FR-type domain-containing protein n=1 Tax=Calycina marina TaxID=1763456 RepID=A0A9P7Z5M6_9HELO|nr:hypothetical protein BJ878DRAFT_418301 [Calycina marina]